MVRDLNEMNGKMFILIIPSPDRESNFPQDLSPPIVRRLPYCCTLCVLLQIGN